MVILCLRFPIIGNCLPQQFQFLSTHYLFTKYSLRNINVRLGQVPKLCIHTYSGLLIYFHDVLNHIGPLVYLYSYIKHVHHSQV
jgi:hypothetical protein